MAEPREGRDGRIALSLLALGIVLVFAEGFAGLVPTMRDFVGFTIPSRAVWRATLVSGDLSAWNPLAGLGLSRLAAPVHGTFYPGHLPLLIGSIETGVVVTWIAHVAWTGLGGYALGRTWGLRPVAAVLPGAVWALGGYAVSMWWNGEKVLTCAWLPWFAWAVLHAARNRGPLVSTSTLAVAATAAMIGYAGDPFLLFDAAGLAVAMLLASDEPSARERIRSAGRAALGTAIGVGLAGPTIVPAWLLRGDTVRAEALTARAAETWSLHPVRLAEFFIPGWFGRPFDVEHYPGGSWADDPTQQALPWAVSIYAGAAVLVFVPFARRRALAAMGGVAFVFLLLAFGRHTPLNGIARWVVPGLSLFRYPEKHVVVVEGLLGLLAGIGFERVVERRVAGWRLATIALGAVALATLAVPATLRASAHLGAWHAAAAVVLLATIVHFSHRRPELSWAVALLAVLDLAFAARPFLRWARPSESAFTSALLERARHAPPRLYRPRAGDFETAATLPDGAAQVFGIATMPGHDPAHSVRVELVTKVLDREPARLARLFALDAIMLPSSESMLIAPTTSDQNWSLYLLPPAPRAWVVGAVRSEAPDATLRTLASATFDPYLEAVVSARDDELVRDLVAEPPARVGECSVATYRRARVELECDARAAGLVVVSELDADGWRASVDGEPRPIYTTDLVLRGVPVVAGRHRVELRYDTPGLFEGSVLAFVSFAGALLAWMTARRYSVRSVTSAKSETAKGGPRA
jgi:hypothetical protein